jgi:hypothetical protein
MKKTETKNPELLKVMNYFSDVTFFETYTGDEVHVYDFAKDDSVSSFGYMFWWNLDEQKCGIEYMNTPGSIQNDEPCRTAQDFINYIEDSI